MDRQRQNPLEPVLIALAFCAACATGVRPATPSAAPQLRTVAGPGSAAERYETSVTAGPAVLDDSAQTITQAVAGAAQKHNTALIGDPRLLALSRWVAEHLAPDGTLPMQAALDEAAHHLGLAEPTPHMVVIATSDRSDLGARLQSDLESMLTEHAYSHYGGAAIEREGLGVYVVSLVFRFLDLAPVPRALAAGRPIVLEGRLHRGYSQAELAVTQPDGHVYRGSPVSGAEFAFKVATRTRGVYRVEILGQAELGIVVVANFPVYVGQAPPERIELPESEAPVKDSTQAALRLLEMIDRERSTSQLNALELDPQLGAIAAAHNADMLLHGFVGHTSKSSGSAVDRVARAGVRTSLVLENIGRGYSLSEVHSGLMSSPGHRGNLLNPLATHVGIGVSVQNEDGHDVYLVTQVFTRVTPKLTGNAAAVLLAAINHERTRLQRQPLQENVALAGVATQAVAQCFAPNKPGDAAVMEVVRQRLPETAASADHVSALLSLAASLHDLSRLDAVLDPNARSIGLALAQGARPDSPPNTICAVVLLAQ